jgi:hypothetical protein
VTRAGPSCWHGRVGHRISDRGARPRRRALRAGLVAGIILAGCSRTGLDVPRDETDEDLAADATSRVPDPGADGDSASEAEGDIDDGGGQFFMTQTPDANRHARGDGEGSAADCGPENCAGCCTEDGVCQSGLSLGACGNHGELCVECGPELSCNFQGTCA